MSVRWTAECCKTASKFLVLKQRIGTVIAGHALTIANFPGREIAQDLALASRTADDLRNLRQNISYAVDVIGG